ncbi:MAG: LysR family transcriptional regulator [Burkholderiaceae bacterium]
MSIRQLEVLACMGEEASITAAAARLHLTQPAVSMQLRQLEDTLELKLFEHVGRRLQITEAGERLARMADEILSRIDDFEQSSLAIRGVRSGRVRLGVVSTSKYFVPALLAMFVRAHPGVELRLTVHNREAIIEQLRTFKVDLGVMGRPPADNAFDGQVFAPNPLAIVASTHHPLTLRRRLSPEVLSDEPILIREPGSGTRAAMERFFAERGLSINPVMEADSNETIKQAVMAGMGIGFLSLHTVRAELAAGRIALLDIEGLPLRRQWYVVTMRSRRLSPAAEEFRGFLLAEAEGLMRSLA